MRLLKKLLAIVLAMMVLALPVASGAFAEIDGWQSTLLDIFGMILEAGDYEDDQPYGYDYEDYDDSAGGSCYDYDWPITDPQQIVNYIYEFGWLPDNFITKAEAKDLGWDNSRNYVGDVAPDMSIGGDKFGNYEGLLPDAPGRQWYECDANYRGKKRGAERVVFSSDGLFYYTGDHYESFTEMFPED